MRSRNFEIEGPIEVIPKRFADSRGYFSETFRLNELRHHIGNVEFVQVNESFSVHSGTIRGIHFQTPPKDQGKLVRCVVGAIFDVAVDLRGGSPSFGRWIAVTLSAATGNQLWIPSGFGHGFSTLEPNCVVSYAVTDYYSPDNDMGVAWDDPDLAIDWPDSADPQTLSEKDRLQPRLAELPNYFRAKDRKCG